MSNLKRCPLCGKLYDEHPALSRKDNKTLICPTCGTREALENIGIIGEEQNKILKASKKFKEKK